MDTINGLEVVRSIKGAHEYRAADEGESDSLGKLQVDFSPFGQWYRISSFWEGDFYESTKRGAFKKTIAERMEQIRVLYEHGYDYQIGNKVLGAIEELSEKKDSPRGIVDLFDTSYNRDLLPGLRAGVYGSSFRFEVIKDMWNDEPERSEHNPEGLPERTILEVRLHEFGPVTFGANPAATSSLRSDTDTYYARMREREPDRFRSVEARARALRTLPDDGPVRAATKPTTEPRQHSGGMTPAERRKRLYVFLQEN